MGRQGFSQIFDIDASDTAQSPLPSLLSPSKNPSESMTLIATTTRLPARILALLGLGAFTLIGFGGARHTIAHWNGRKGSELAYRQEVMSEQQRAIAAIEAKELEIEGQFRLAESYSELGTKQASCGDTLSQFYFTPGSDVMEQLAVWGFDWQTPRYNTDKWYPLFDSAGLLFAAIRQNPATGYQQVVQADQQKLDQASICNRNELFTEN